MITWTTYGSWLPGNEKGYVENGKILEGNIKLLEKNKNRQKTNTVKLNKTEKQIVRNTILSEAEKIGHKIEGLIVYSNHIHLLARPHKESIEGIVGRYKSITTSVLWKHGRQGRIWTKGYDKRFCFTEEDITKRKLYINKH
ncbi:MAG: transposase [Sedimentisphaerales bacterium]|nr:transposase [Sedimentisphaerales bacterium]